MSDEAIISAPVTAAPEAAIVSAPVEAAPVVTEAAPVVEVTVEAPVDAPKPLLAPVEDTQTETVEPAEAQEVTPEPVVDAEPAPLPVYEFKLPEGTQVDSESFKAFNTKLGEFQNLTKSQQDIAQKLGQDFIDMHVNEIKNVVENQNKAAWDWFKSRNTTWLETAKNDPSIGGENFDATISSAAQAVSLYGGTKVQQAEVAKVLQETGVENHPAILRLLSNITKVAAKEGSPVTSRVVPVQKASPSQMMYGGGQ